MFFEKGALVFGQLPDKNREMLLKRVNQEEHIALKKSLGEVQRTNGLFQPFGTRLLILCSATIISLFRR